MSRITRIKNKLVAQNSIEFTQLIPNKALVLDANKTVISSSVSSSELENLAGTTSPIQDQIDEEKEKINAHIDDVENPHEVTKEQIGLGNVDNTSDINKPISTATQTALNSKYDASNPSGFVDSIGAAAAAPVQSVAGQIGDVSLDKYTIGLSNVDNTSDLDKPISEATQIALNTKQDLLGFTPENVANKSVDSNLGLSDTLYPSQKAVKNYVDNSIATATVPDATSSIKGILKLTGDLGGSADSPTVPGLANKANISHNHALSDLTQSSALTGQVVTWNGTNWIPATPTAVITDHTQLTNIGINTHDQIDSHISAITDVHGIGPANSVVGTSTSQILKNKTIDADLNTISNIDNADIKSGAAIDRSKLAPNNAHRVVINNELGVMIDAPAITASRALISNTDGIPTHSSVTSTELSYVSGVTSAIQTQISNKADVSHTQALSTLTQSGAITGQVPVWNGTEWTPGIPSGTATWGGISGTLSNQTDLQSALNAKFDDPTGTINQYIRGDGSLAVFPTSINQANSLVTTVFNASGSLIPKFSVVYISGGQGDLPKISLAQANGESSSSKTYGVVFSDIPNMEIGQVIVAGALTGLNTDQFNPTAPMGNVNGVALYLSPTVPGGLTTTKPFAPNHIVYVATIVRTHQNEGVVEVRIQNGFELEELHNVQILNGSQQNNQVLKYDTSLGLWKNKYIGVSTDIEHSSFSGSNNQSSASDITGLLFNSSLVRSAKIMISVFVDADIDLFEEVEISLLNKNGLFFISTEGIGDNSNVKFSITNSGQIQYTSGNYTGFNSLVIKYRALTTTI